MLESLALRAPAALSPAAATPALLKKERRLIVLFFSLFIRVLSSVILRKKGSAQESDDLPERLAFSEKDLWLA